MKNELVVYHCPRCGFTLDVISAGKAGLSCSGESFAKTCEGVHHDLRCCGQKMEMLKANTVEASTEKHIPVITKRDGDRITVQVGSVEHPMTAEHKIDWVAVVCCNRVQRAALAAGDKPVAEFCVCCGNGELAVYAFCNLHGLWRA
ncbi:MAG: desulfoferrodoxin family protein [Negativicutes bacterium]|nr:desulfoferrodoxin family protein [Negativicutes bacterium]